ncbi:MAG TPA: peptidylprolyl isomerase, partial [Clostridiales bacterium]|nr:peptidylprolyl isomerase [Clostridiales bacterium]
MNIIISVVNFGDITAELYPEYAPKTVESFVNLIKTTFFDGLIFHRVIPGFMIQGGGYTR